MERLTELVNGELMYSCRGQHFNSYGEFQYAVLNKLAQYENTGLTPQEVEELKKENAELKEKYEIRKYNSEELAKINLQRSLEVLETQEENVELKARLEKSVELPCKVGDIVYDISFGHINEYEIIAFDLYPEMKIAIYEIDYEDRFGLDFHRFGETVFLTREEAKQALKEHE